MIDFTPIWLSLKLAFWTTILLFLISLPLGHWLAFSKNRFKVLIETLVSMPLVLPPTVLGFYLLIMFSPQSPFGQWISETIGFQLVFSFGGLVFASIIYSLPFMVQPLQAGFASIDTQLIEAAQTMGKSKWSILKNVLLPNITSSVVTGVVLSFAHTIGEFGVVLMIGGNIPGVTRVASIAVYDEVESLNYAAANIYSAILFGMTFIILLTVYFRRSSMKTSLLR